MIYSGLGALGCQLGRSGMRGRGRVGVRWGGGGGGGPGGGVPGGGGILNISLFGVISPGMRPNGVFFGLFWAFFDPPPETGVFATFGKSQNSGPEFCRRQQKLFYNFYFYKIILQNNFVMIKNLSS